MSYRAGVGPVLAARIGIESGHPRIVCDGCGLVRAVETAYGLPYEWFMKNRAAPGWKLERTEEPFTRKDWCPSCRATPSDTSGKT